MGKSLGKEQPPERGAGGGGRCCLGLGRETRRQLREEMPWEELGEGQGAGERKWRRKRVAEEEWEAGKQEGKGGKKNNS